MNSEFIFLQLAEGMKAINEKLVHRDIKPDNILRSGDQLKIADFGLSKVVGAATRTNTMKGTNHIVYCAPEAWKVEANYLLWTCILWASLSSKLLLSRLPYDVPNHGNPMEAWKNAHLWQEPLDPRTLNPQLDVGLSQVILKMISKRPDDRYERWDDVIVRLNAGRSIHLAGRNVDALVKRALEGQRKAEQIRLENERKEAAVTELRGLVQYSFGEIVQAATQTIDAFNNASDVAKLRKAPAQIVNSWSIGFTIFAEGPGVQASQVLIFVVPVYEEHELHDQRINAWGFAKSPSGRGFNLISPV